MKTLFTTILLASAVISAPAFAEEAEVKDVLAGNAAELSSTEMQTTEGAWGGWGVMPVCCTSPTQNINQQNFNQSQGAASSQSFAAGLFAFSKSGGNVTIKGDQGNHISHNQN